VTRQLSKVFLLLNYFLWGSGGNAFADTVSNPCAGLLAIVDRPTVADSACVVPYGNIVGEFGYQYQELRMDGQQQNFPEAEIRLGLPGNNELVVLLPNYIHQTKPSQSGDSATTVGIKHEIGYTQHWLGAVESLFLLPSGSNNFGSEGLGVTVNGIISYTFNPQFNLTFMLGETSQTTSNSQGGKRYTSTNPDLVFTWSPMEKIDIYAEVYGQSNTGPDAGSGFNFDGGIIYLLSKNLTIDIEYGQRLSGALGGFNHYIGAGFAIFI
jgi:hypothetical protein